ncbi:MAG: GNAT family N-acetyltransferase [Pseudomonadota bacterium]
MSASLTIRPVAPGDMRDITAIYAHAVIHGTASFEIEPPSEAEMNNRRIALESGGFPYLVAAIGGRVAGYAYAGPYRTRIAYRYTVEDSVYIHPDAHRQGVGRRLLTELIAQAEARGFRQMIAVIGDSAQTSSIALHRSLGFTLVGTFRNIGFKHGRWLDSVLMQRALGEGANAAP